MTDSLPLPTEWVLDASQDPPVYTRPVVGSELFFHKYWQMVDADGQVCIGIDFTSSLGLSELEDRARAALDKFRFLCPIIACTIEDVVSPRWVYTPSADRKAWLDLAFTVEERGASLNASAFLQSIDLERLPYTDGNKTTTFIRVYLLTTSEGAANKEYGLYIHGVHAMMDAAPALHALNLMCEWISGTGIDVRIESLEEWKNLPVDPVTATGGPRKEWETSGVRLLQDFQKLWGRTTPCHMLAPPSYPLDMSHPPLRYATSLSESETAAIVAATKKLGVSVSALFHAAHCLAQFKMNPIPEPTTDIDFPGDITIVALERYFKPPIDPRTHFISSFVLMPLRFSMAPSLMEPSEKASLIMTAKLVQDRFDKYLAEPCLPQLLVVAANAILTALASKPGREANVANQVDTDGVPPPSLPWHTLMNNLGIIEHKVRTDHDVLSVDNVRIGTRFRNHMPVHMWTLRSRFYFQVQGSTAWGEECIKTLLQETLRIASLVVEPEP